MRRFWTYILLAFASIITVGTVFPLFVEKTTSNIEYSVGRQITFRIDKNDDDDAKEVDSEGNAVKEIAKIMENRLITANVSRYQINIEGNDTITVSFYQSTDTNYDSISTYLSFNGSLALTSKYNAEKPENFKYVTSDIFFDSKSPAYRTTKYYDAAKVDVPVFVLPVNKNAEQYKEVLTEAQDASNSTAVSSGQNEEGEEQTTNQNFLYLWYNFNEHSETDVSFWDPTNSEVAGKYLLTTFDVTPGDDNKIYLDGEEDNKLFAYNENALSADPKTKRQGYEQLDLMVNLLNAGKLDYKVTKMFEKDETMPWVEPLVTYGNGRTMAFNRTIVATIIAILVISLLMAIYFRIGTVGVIAMTLLTVFFGFGSIILLSAEFSTLSIIAMVALTMASLASGIIYLSKLKNECYKGKSIKKANQDAAKKSLMPIIDINVSIIAIGIFCYVFGGVLMRTFAVITVLGGIVSMLLNTLGLRGMMWLATNTTQFRDKYEYFGVHSDKVPDAMKNEKQTYFGDFAGKNLTKKTKKVAIVNAVIAGLCLIGTIVFSSLPSMGTYRNPSTSLNSRVYFDTIEESSDVVTEDFIKEFLGQIYMYEGEYDSSKEYKSLADSVSSFDIYSEQPYEIVSTYIPEGSDENIQKHYVSVANLSSVVTLDAKAFTSFEGEEPVFDTIGNILNDISSERADVDISLKEGTQISSGEINTGKVILGTGIALAVLAIYFMLRYKFSRGLSTLLVTLSTSIITYGLFSVTRLAVTNYVAAIVPVIALFTLIVSVMFMSEEKDLLLDNKSKGKDVSFETRNEIMERGNSIAFSSMVMSTIMIVYLAINFFGFGSKLVAMPFALMAIMVLYTLLVVSCLNGPLSLSIAKKFSNFHLPEIKRKKKVVNQVKKSAEPEEAVFPGIND